MIIADLSPGDRIRGPSGVIYTVVRCEPTHVVCRTPYPTQSIDGRQGTGAKYVRFDRVAIERFRREDDADR